MKLKRKCFVHCTECKLNCIFRMQDEGKDQMNRKDVGHGFSPTFFERREFLVFSGQEIVKQKSNRKSSGFQKHKHRHEIISSYTVSCECVLCCGPSTMQNIWRQQHCELYVVIRIAWIIFVCFNLNEIIRRQRQWQRQWQGYRNTNKLGERNSQEECGACERALARVCVCV